LAIWILIGSLEAFLRKRLSIGPTLAHMGVGLSLLGISVGGGLRHDETKVLQPKESLSIGNRTLTLQEVTQGKGSTYLYEKAILTSEGSTLTPEKRLYQPQNSLISETAVLTNGLSDLYVILGPYQGNNRWLIRVSIIPLAPWIWIGGLLMAFGAFVSLLSRKKLLVFFLLFAPLPAFSIETANDFYREVRCPVCAGQSIADSETPAAQSLKEFISRELQKGESPESIREELRQRYGTDILFRPPMNQKTLFLWGLPFALFFLILIGFLWKAFYSRTR